MNHMFFIKQKTAYELRISDWSSDVCSSDLLYAVVNERDGLGDELVPDYLTAVRKGGFYGWPYAYIGPNPQPGFAERRPDLVKKTIVPDVLFESHSAPIGLVFAKGGQFPEDRKSVV